MAFSANSICKISRQQFLCGAALLALSVPASAQSIDTTPLWNGTSSITSWGIPNTATYGQTFTPVAGQTRLSAFTMELGQIGGPAPQYQAFVYQFANNRISGPALFSSGVFTAPTGAAFTPVTINTGNVILTPGQQYVVFLTTSTQTNVGPSSYRFGALTNNTAIPNGQFVFMNNGTVFADLAANPWSNIGEDLAFKAFLTAQNAGENNTQAQLGAFQLGNSYLSLLTDPFATNRVGTTGPMGYAADKKLPPAVSAANAMVTKAPPIVYSPRWDVWGAAFGGSNNTRGEAGPGTSDTRTQVGGVAAGADYRYAPDTLIGFSLAGGNINWSLSGAGLGGGASDAFMAGIYGKHTFGPGYVSGAVTYTNYWMRTDRSSDPTSFDHLHANFDAESWGGRLEAGYRVPGNWMMVQWTPYGAIQGQSFRTPGFSEIAPVGSPALGLTFDGRTATAFRGEIGLRSDKVVAIDQGSQLNLFGKLAYAHDEVSDPSVNANFTALGGGVGTPFTVFGARQSPDLVLVTGGAEWRLATGVSFLAKFDGEFGDRSETYSATGRIRYTW
jgi:outer membrane autotransporter protein